MPGDLSSLEVVHKEAHSASACEGTTCTQNISLHRAIYAGAKLMPIAVRVHEAPESLQELSL